MHKPLIRRKDKHHVFIKNGDLNIGLFLLRSQFNYGDKQKYPNLFDSECPRIVALTYPDIHKPHLGFCASNMVTAFKYMVKLWIK